MEHPEDQNDMVQSHMSKIEDVIEDVNKHEDDFSVKFTSADEFLE